MSFTAAGETDQKATITHGFSLSETFKPSRRCHSSNTRLVVKSNEKAAVSQRVGSDHPIRRPARHNQSDDEQQFAVGESGAMPVSTSGTEYVFSIPGAPDMKHVFHESPRFGSETDDYPRFLVL